MAYPVLNGYQVVGWLSVTAFICLSQKFAIVPKKGSALPVCLSEAKQCEDNIYYNILSLVKKNNTKLRRKGCDISRWLK